MRCATLIAVLAIFSANLDAQQASQRPRPPSLADNQKLLQAFSERTDETQRELEDAQNDFLVSTALAGGEKLKSARDGLKHAFETLDNLYSGYTIGGDLAKPDYLEALYGVIVAVTAVGAAVSASPAIAAAGAAAGGFELTRQVLTIAALSYYQGDSIRSEWNLRQAISYGASRDPVVQAQMAALVAQMDFGLPGQRRTFQAMAAAVGMNQQDLASIFASTGNADPFQTTDNADPFQTATPQSGLRILDPPATTASGSGQTPIVVPAPQTQGSCSTCLQRCEDRWKDDPNDLFSDKWMACNQSCNQCSDFVLGR